MPDVVLVDTGPLVALVDRSDTARAACKASLATLEPFDLVTSEAVVTEASYLLDHSPALQVELQQLLSTPWIRIEAIVPADRTRIAELLQKFADQPMDYADATLVTLAERLRTTRIFTLDRRDFSVYRARSRRFDIIP